MIRAILPPRRSDRWGNGAFGASRGERTHQGIDYACHPGSQILAARPGTVTKIGYPYGSGAGAAGTQNPYRYLEIQDEYGYLARYFYIAPLVMPGDLVEQDEPIGTVQDLTERYPGITNHVHFEVRHPSGEIIDPEQYP